MREPYRSVAQVRKEMADRFIRGGHGAKAEFARKVGISAILISQMTLMQKHDRRTLPARVLRELGYDTRVYYKRIRP